MWLVVVATKNNPNIHKCIEALRISFEDIYSGGWVHVCNGGDTPHIRMVKNGWEDNMFVVETNCPLPLCQVPSHVIAKYPNADIVTLLDGDCIVQHWAMQEVYEVIYKEAPIICGASRAEVMSDSIVITPRPQFGRFFGSFTTFPQDKYWECGGYNPFMTGWGYMDFDFIERIMKCGCKGHLLPTPILHLSHPRLPKGEEAIQERYNQDVARESVYDKETFTWTFRGNSVKIK